MDKLTYNINLIPVLSVLICKISLIITSDVPRVQWSHPTVAPLVPGWWPPTCSSCSWHRLMSAPGSDHSLPLTRVATAAAISTALLCSPFPNAINLNDTQIDSIPIFEHQLKNTSKQQIRLMMHLIRAGLIQRLCLCVAWPAQTLRTCIPRVRALCVINCK